MSHQQQLTTLNYDDIIINIGKGMCHTAALFNSLSTDCKTSSEVVQDIKDAMNFLIEHIDVSIMLEQNIFDVMFPCLE